MDTNKKRILLAASIVATVAALSLAFVWQSGSADQVADSTNVIVRGHRPVVDTDEFRTTRLIDDHEVKPIRTIRHIGKYKPSHGRRNHHIRGGMPIVIKNKNVPVL